MLTLAAVLVATTCHEFAHALVADRLGDPTPRALGRLTLNPLVHLDLLGTLSFVLFGFGWARPVPVNSRNFQDPRQGTLQVALAGPLANVTVAFVVGAVMQIPWGPVKNPLWVVSGVGMFVFLVVWINVILAIFNLIPIPPLDGSRVVESLLPAPQAIAFSRLQPYGIIVLFVLLSSRDVRHVLGLAAGWLFRASTGLGGLPGF